jgi:hypothetical protein
MGVIGQKGTYATVQAPKDYLGSALSNIEQTNFRYRQEKEAEQQRKEAVIQAEEIATQERGDKALKESREFKTQDYGVSPLTESSHVITAKMADEVSSILNKKIRTSEDNARLSVLYSNLDKMKIAASNLKPIIADRLNALSNGKVNTEILENKGNGNPLLSLLNIENAQTIIDENGDISLKTIDPETQQEIVIPYNKLQDPNYIMSLIPDKKNIYDDNGLIENIRKTLVPQSTSEEVGNKTVSFTGVTPEQRAEAKNYISNSLGLSQDNVLKDVAQQLGLDFHWKTPQERDNLVKAVENKALSTAEMGVKKENSEKYNQAYVSPSEQASINKANRSDSGQGENPKNPNFLTTLTKPTVINTKMFNTGDKAMTVNAVKGSKLGVEQIIEKSVKGKDGKYRKDYYIVGARLKREVLKQEAKDRKALDPYYEYAKEDFIQEGGDDFAISYKDNPTDFASGIKGVLDENGKPYNSVKEAIQANFPRQQQEKSQTTPKVYAGIDPKTGKAIYK